MVDIIKKQWVKDQKFFTPFQKNLEAGDPTCPIALRLSDSDQQAMLSVLNYSHHPVGHFNKN